MTRQEAIEMLKALNMMLRNPDGEPISDVCYALGMAIEALSKPSGDLISRADAIEAVCDKCPISFKEKCEWKNNGHCSMKVSLEALPSAEAVQGEWIDIDNSYRIATCSHCHKVTMFEKWGEHTKPYDFCPNCGAHMQTE